MWLWLFWNSKTSFVDQAGPKFRNLPASVSRLLELKVCGLQRLTLPASFKSRFLLFKIKAP